MIFKTIFKLLSFQISKDELLQFNQHHFTVGLIGTWLVGIGRYWDDPGAKLLQHLGLGSVIYIFLLALFIWLIVLPFKIKHWSYFTVLTFISLTSFPAIFYAIPVERFMSIEIANKVNVWFLGIVALWRLSLLFYFLKKFTRLHFANIITSALLPICTIIATLWILNLHRVVFFIMGGVREPSAHDASYTVLTILTLGSVILFVPLLIGYFIGIFNHRKKLNE